MEAANPLFDRILFERGELRLSLLDEVAPNYFRFLQTILIDYILLQFGRITDPAISSNFENFTAAYVAARLDWPPEVQSKLDELLKGLNKFRDNIISARNKLIAHADLASHAGNDPLGEFPEGAEQRFLDTLQEFVNLAHDRLIGGPYPLDAVTPGDADDLLRILKQGVILKKLFERDPDRYDTSLRESRFFDA